VVHPASTARAGRGVNPVWTCPYAATVIQGYAGTYESGFPDECAFEDWLFRIEGIAEDERCACRKCHPCWSGRMVVFVEDAAEPWASADIETVDLGLFGERRRQWL
jgi:hypothetical protein